MEGKNDNVTSRTALQSLFVQQTLKSWRFFLLFSVPPMIWVIFAAPPAFSRIFITLMCGIVWFGCWRLWLDTHYFRLTNEENNELVGNVLFVLWGRERLQRLTYDQRQLGALIQFRRTFRLTGALWIVWLIALL
jgi:hypothetical protein